MSKNALILDILMYRTFIWKACFVPWDVSHFMFLHFPEFHLKKKYGLKENASNPETNTSQKKTEFGLVLTQKL